MPETNNETTGLKVTEEWYITKPKNGPFSRITTFNSDEIFGNRAEFLMAHDHRIYISEVTPFSLKGKIVFDIDGAKSVEMGEFELDVENPIYCTDYKTVIYDTEMKVTLELMLNSEF